MRSKYIPSNLPHFIYDELTKRGIRYVDMLGLIGEHKIAQPYDIVLLKRFNDKDEGSIETVKRWMGCMPEGCTLVLDPRISVETIKKIVPALKKNCSLNMTEGLLGFLSGQSSLMKKWSTESLKAIVAAVNPGVYFSPPTEITKADAKIIVEKLGPRVTLMVSKLIPQSILIELAKGITRQCILAPSYDLEQEDLKAIAENFNCNKRGVLYLHKELDEASLGAIVKSLKERAHIMPCHKMITPKLRLIAANLKPKSTFVVHKNMPRRVLILIAKYLHSGRYLAVSTAHFDYYEVNIKNALDQSCSVFPTQDVGSEEISIYIRKEERIPKKRKRANFFEEGGKYEISPRDVANVSSLRGAPKIKKK